MKTKSAKKLTLGIETLRVLEGDALDGVVGGARFGIVSTDTPSLCFGCPTKPKLPKA